MYLNYELQLGGDRWLSVSAVLPVGGRGGGGRGTHDGNDLSSHGHYRSDLQFDKYENR